MTRPLLSRRLALEAAETTRDDSGGIAELWVLRGWRWAELSPVSAAAPRGLDGGAITHRAVLRWSPETDPLRPKAGMRFREGRRVFRIAAATEADSRFRWLTCWIEEDSAA